MMLRDGRVSKELMREVKGYKVSRDPDRKIERRGDWL
jgi:hypothetical protein